MNPSPVAISTHPMIVSCALWIAERNCSPMAMITPPSTIETSTCATPARPEIRATLDSG